MGGGAGGATSASTPQGRGGKEEARSYHTLQQVLSTVWTLRASAQEPFRDPYAHLTGAESPAQDYGMSAASPGFKPRPG